MRRREIRIQLKRLVELIYRSVVLACEEQDSGPALIVA